MNYFYSGYIIIKNTGQKLANSHGVINICDVSKLISTIESEMISYYNGSFPKELVTVHIISLNKVG